ncbi:MAG: hypothetical protein GY847_00455 [Proteobacteria bacterium]|nr:hypothetical protein [Pseudomonadota bacterium]
MSFKNTWYNLAKLSIVSNSEDQKNVQTLFDEEINRQCELVLGQRGESIGIMVKNKGYSFSSRVKKIMRSWSVHPAGSRHFVYLEKDLSYRKLLVKFDWYSCKQLKKTNKRLTYHFLCYTPLPVVLDHLRALSILPGVLVSVSQVAEILDSSSVAFVSCTLERERTPKYKLYFLQGMPGQSKQVPAGRLTDLKEYLELSSISECKTLEIHEAFFKPEKRMPFLISINFSHFEVYPTFKADYFDIEPEDCSVVFSEEERKEEVLRVKNACRLIGNERIPSLGVRFQGNTTPKLKYYMKYEPNK